MNQLLTYGYGGPRPAQAMSDLLLYAEAGALILDCRLTPYSPNPTFRKETLAGALGAGYRHVRALGNVRYKLGPPIEILDLAVGLRELEVELRRRPVVLLCACELHAACHRSTVATEAELALPGLVVRHLGRGEAL